MEQNIFYLLVALASVTTLLMWKQVIDPRTLLLPGLMWIYAGFGATNYEIITRCCVTRITHWPLALLMWLIAFGVLLYWIGAVSGRVGIETNANN